MSGRPPYPPGHMNPGGMMGGPPGMMGYGPPPGAFPPHFPPPQPPMMGGHNGPPAYPPPRPHHPHMAPQPSQAQLALDHEKLLAEKVC